MQLKLISVSGLPWPEDLGLKSHKELCASGVSDISIFGLQSKYGQTYHANSNFVSFLMQQGKMGNQETCKIFNI